MISVVIPVKDEAESLPVLFEQLKAVLQKIDISYEVIFIDDGSSDNSVMVLDSISDKNKNVIVIKHRANFGKSLALAKGFEKASGDVIITMDADLQDDPTDIPNLLKKINEGYDLVSGWRKKRADTLTKRISSYLFNAGTSWIAGINIHDSNCGLKAMTKEVADDLFLRGELHRFIPILAFKKKYKVTEVTVNNRLRKFGKSKYGKLGISRGWKGMLDLLTTIFVTDFSTKPAHFFGGIGLVFFSTGFLMDLYVTYIKISTGTTQSKLPLLLAGMLFLLIGIQLMSTGLIAEMIAYYLTRSERTEKN